LQRHRIAAGLQFRFQMVRVGAHFVTDAVDPQAANEDDNNAFFDDGSGNRIPKFDGIDKQYTMAFDFGLVL
jgi:hypothetical protein